MSEADAAGGERRRPRSWRRIALCLGVVAVCAGVGQPGGRLAAATGAEPATARPVVVPPAPLADVLGIPPGAGDTLLDEDAELKAQAQASFIEGLLHEHDGRTERMLEEFQNALDLDPGNSLLAQKLALEYVRAGDVPAGIGVLKDAAKFDRDNPQLQLLLATFYARSLKKFAVAEDYARRALALEPDNAAAYELLLSIFQAGERSAASRRLLAEAADVESGDPQFWLACGELAARALLGAHGGERALAESDVALAGGFFKRALELAGDDPLVLNRVGGFHLLTRQAGKAVATYRRLLELPELDEAGRVDASEKLARAHLMNGQRDAAIDMLEQVLESNPLSRETYEFLGRIHEQDGDLEQALANYEQALLIQPARPLAYLKVADIYVRMDKPQRAVEVLREARDKLPELPQLTYSLAIAYSQAGRHQLAMKTFELALAEARDSGENIATAGFHFNYGVAADAAGEFELAVENFKQVIAMAPDNAAPALNYLGYMMALRGENLDQAERYIQRALELDPRNGAYVDSLGWVYYQQGRYQKALAQLLRAESLIDADEPANFEIFDHIGDAYAKLGQLAEAVAYWRKALDLDPDNQAIAAKIEDAELRVSARGDTAPAAPGAQ